MKKVYTFLFAVILTATIIAQTPQKMSYQAVIRNASNVLVTSSPVGMRVSILQGSPTGTEVYKEIYNPNPQTNVNGLVTIEIGGGIPLTGTFSGINWSTGPYFIKTETDPTGGTSYTITGTSQLLSVPYALYSKNVASYLESDPVFTGWNKSSGINITASQVSDFQSSVSNNASMLANTAKVTNATHTGDATGATSLTVTGINGTSLAGLATGILKNTTSTGVPIIAIAGTDYLAPNGSAALLTNFPILNQNTTGTASNVIGIVALTNGGTGASTATGARANLGLGTLAPMSTVGSAEITNGSILGADIAPTTITSSNLAIGSVTTANIADGTITTVDVASIDASQISGIGANVVAKSNGTGLVASQIIDNGTYCWIGTTGNAAAKLSANASGSLNNGIYTTASNTSNSSNYGIYSIGSGGTSYNYGVYSRAYGGSYNYAFAGWIQSGTATSINYGVSSYVNSPGTINYGVLGYAYGATTNWAGYFEGGNVYIDNQIQAPYLGSSSGTTLVLDASGWIRRLSSDSRLKENITPLNNSLERVLQLQGVNFTWRSDSTHLPDIGFIAQDVQKVLPELVVKDNNDGLLSVKYQNMVAILTEAIKEQQKQIDELKTLITNLVAKQTGQGNK